MKSCQISPQRREKVIQYKYTMSINLGQDGGF